MQKFIIIFLAFPLLRISERIHDFTSIPTESSYRTDKADKTQPASARELVNTVEETQNVSNYFNVVNM